MVVVLVWVVAGVLTGEAVRPGGSGCGLKAKAGVALATKAITKNNFLVILNSIMFVDPPNLPADG